MDKLHSHTEPQIWNSVVQNLKLPLADHNVDVDKLFRDCALCDCELDGPQGQIPLTRYLNFLNSAEQAAQEPLISIQIAKAAGAALLGALGFLFLSSRTLYEAINSLIYYQNLLQESTAMSFFQEGDYYVFGYEVYGVGNIDVRSDVELSLSFTSQMIKSFSNNQVKPERFMFRHSPSTALTKYQHLLGAPCYFNQDHNQIYIKVEDARHQNSRHDPSLTQILRNYLDADLADKLTEHDFTDQVRKTILKMQTNKVLTASRVANNLGLSKATFDRRLRESGTTFKTLNNQIQYEVACKYLSGSRLNIYQISQLLGFSSSASFTRAFCKWSDGQSPSAFRKSRESNS